MELQNKLLTVIKRHLPQGGGKENLEMSSNLLQLGLDSMGTIDLMLDIEQEFEIELPDEALTANAFKTAHDIALFIPATEGTL